MSSATTKHSVLRQKLEKDLDAFKRPPHTPFYSERELIKKYALSLPTVRKALADLVTSGRLYRKQGSGTFIAPSSKRHLLLLTGAMTVYPAVIPEAEARFLGGLMTSDVVSESAWLPQYTTSTSIKSRLENLDLHYPSLKGVIVFRQPELLEELKPILDLKKIPVLFYGSSTWKVRLKNVSAIFFNEEAVIQLALEAIQKKGLRKIATLSRSTREVEVYRNQLILEKAPLFGLKVVHQIAYQSAIAPFHVNELELLKAKKVELILATTDILAIHFINLATKNAFHIPNDFKVLGINHSPMGRHCVTPLSTIDLHEATGALLAFELIQKLQTTKRQLTKNFQDFELVSRETF